MTEKFFTLVELIVVIAIIAILAAIITPNAFKAIEKAKVSEAIGDFKAYKAAIYALYADTGHWVTDSQPDGCLRLRYHPDNDLTSDYSHWPGWDGPYLEKIKGKTPWYGTYWLEDTEVVGRPWVPQILLAFDDLCYPDGPAECPVPRSSARIIDRMLDDDNLNSGDFWVGTGSNASDYMWTLMKK